MDKNKQNQFNDYPDLVRHDLRDFHLYSACLRHFRLYSVSLHDYCD